MSSWGQSWGAAWGRTWGSIFVKHGGDDAPEIYRWQTWPKKKKAKVIEEVIEAFKEEVGEAPQIEAVKEAILEFPKIETKTYNPLTWANQQEVLIKMILAIQQETDDEETLLLLM